MEAIEMAVEAQVPLADAQVADGKSARPSGGNDGQRSPKRITHRHFLREVVRNGLHVGWRWVGGASTLGFSVATAVVLLWHANWVLGLLALLVPLALLLGEGAFRAWRQEASEVDRLRDPSRQLLFDLTGFVDELGAFLKARYIRRPFHPPVISLQTIEQRNRAVRHAKDSVADYHTQFAPRGKRLFDRAVVLGYPTRLEHRTDIESPTTPAEIREVLEAFTALRERIAAAPRYGASEGEAG